MRIKKNLTANDKISRFVNQCVVRYVWVYLLPLVVIGCAPKAGPSALTLPSAVTAERQAVAFLIREVPAWSRENGCFSCHNNGDAARALYVASRKGHRVPAAALADTTAWLSRPDNWKNNKGDPGFSDQRLANLQFAAALLTAIETGHIQKKSLLAAAAVLVAADQASAGSWPVEPANPIGSPATYGTPLATYTGWRILQNKAAAEWLRQIKPLNTPAASTLLLLSTNQPALNFLLRAQTSEGGWGPYADSPPEAFDTALALLAIAKHHHEPNVPRAIERGRHFLAALQQPDGAWPPTTRPPGGESYAQRLSTAGWATLALLETRP